MYKIIFFGTSEFAVPSLEALAQDRRFEIAGVVTQPDRPVGRHAVMTPPPVKKATSHELRATSLPLKQPEKIKDEDFQTWIKEVGPSCDAFVVVSYGKILPQWLLDLPKKGAVNVHGSLLPRWRGASPIQAAIAAGDTVSGVTIMKIDAEMDHGPLLEQAEEQILPTDTGGSLHDKLATLGAKLLPDVLAGYLEGKIEPKEQDHSLATHCKTLSRDDGRIDWTKTSAEIERLVRAYDPWPGTWTEVGGKRLKILAAHVSSVIPVRRGGGIQPGGRFVQDGLPCISCANGTTLVIEKLQREGGTIQSGESFLRGFLDSFSGSD